MVDQIKNFIIDEMCNAKAKFESEDNDEQLIALIQHHTLESILIVIFKMERRMQ